MRVIALIDDPPVVQRILEWPTKALVPLTYHSVPYIA